MRLPNRSEIDQLRTEYPVGSRIKLIYMEDPYATVKPGDIMTVQSIDDMGQIHGRWNNSSSLALIPEADVFRKI